MSKNTRHLFYIIAIINGAAILTVEIAATRLLSPYFGASVFVWTSSISVILGALTIGYFIGSRCSRNENVRFELTRAFVIASITTFIAPFIVRIIGQTLPTIYAGELPTLESFIVTLSAALIALMPAGVAYGLVSPLIIEILGRDHDHPGEVSGRIFALSTTGSIIGAIATPLIFYVAFGTHMTFAVAASVVMLLAAVSAEKKKLLFVVGAALLFFLGLLTQPDPLKNPGIIYAEETPYQTVRLFENDTAFQMIFNQGLGTQSMLTKDEPWTNHYWDWLTFVPYFHEKQELETAIIGFAGGTIARLWESTPVSEKIASVNAVDVDPAVFEITRKYFSKNLFGATPIVADGRQFLAATDQKYDLILVDAYANEMQIPFHMTTVEFFSLTQERLNDNGFLVFNLGIGSDSHLSKPLMQSTRAIFDHVYAFNVPQDLNTLIIASNHSVDFAQLPEVLEKTGMPTLPHFSVEKIAQDDSVKPFTDDRAPVEVLTDLSVFGLQ